MEMNAPASMHETRIMTQLPDMGSGPIPVEPYISPEYFKREQEKIFKRAWINVGCVSSYLPNPGDYMVRELEVIGASILLVHGRDGVVRGFHNVCTHRGNPVAKDSGNARSAFVCAFHGWAFGLDGSLKTVPSEEQFPGLDRAQYGLKPITTEVWHGWIFINAQEKPTTSLVDFLGGWGEQMAGVPYEQYTNTARFTTRLKCNWKVYIDAFQEAYHVGVVHAESFPVLAANREVFVPTSLRTYGPHRSISAWVDPTYTPSPAESIVWKYGATLSHPAGTTGGSPAINPSNDENWWFDINVCFPNFFIDVGAGWFFTYNFFPVSVDETYWEVNLYQLHAKTLSEKVVQAHMEVVLRDALYEDLSTMEGCQRGLSSGVLKTILPGDFEVLLRHQYWAVEQWVNAA
jgi:phenylpropionate dioxygenase-like ring-hydroxylating dioxygenase large terminal subunit